ncbi:DgyrCDS5718 [Dimorphilus gyrociliatus]|uniref:Translocon-associated protein subunit beta n=1 Tax=Dimorphilus gyrociliatus TaxID=2664684 RepID=A0A7I8VLC6_9ANNE|nr:DgyrCDS5718 [Dimorphilus gyrociliatus]
MKSILFLAALVAIVYSEELEESRGRILASKSVLNNMLVESREVTVEYVLFNMGKSSALKVQLTDNTFPADQFEVVSGSLQVSWARIAPGSNVTHVVILKPKSDGMFNFTSAEVSYLASEKDTKETLGSTSAPGLGRIIAFQDYDRKYSPHYLDWLAFTVMCLPSLAIPFMLWYNSKSKYEQIKTKKN